MSGKLLFKGREGSLLIGLIVTMVIVSIAGAATYYLTTGSSITELFKNNNLKAYYLAESGARYAAHLVQSDLDNGTTTYINALNNKSCTLSPGQFTLTIDNTSNAAYLLLKSVGTLNSGSWFETKREVVYKLTKSFNEPFDPNTFSKNWDVISGHADAATQGGCRYPATPACVSRRRAAVPYPLLLLNGMGRAERRTPACRTFSLNGICPEGS